MLWRSFDEIFIKTPQSLCVTFWHKNGRFSLKSRFSNNFLVSPQCLCVIFSTKFIKVTRTQDDWFLDLISNDKRPKNSISTWKLKQNMGCRTIHKFQIIPETFPFMELLAIKISAFEISKQLKNIIKISKSIKNYYVT